MKNVVNALEAKIIAFNVQELMPNIDNYPYVIVVKVILRTNKIFVKYVILNAVNVKLKNIIVLLVKKV